MSEDPCRFMAGPFSLHMTTMNPEYTGTEKFCQKIPIKLKDNDSINTSTNNTNESGRAVVIFDFLEPELRGKDIKVSIVNAESSETLITLPAKQYPTGSLYFYWNISLEKLGQKFLTQIEIIDGENTYNREIPLELVKKKIPGGNDKNFINIFLSILALALLYFFFKTRRNAKT